MDSDRLVLPPGPHLQIYLNAIPAKVLADRAAALDAELEDWRSIGVAGVVLHGFPRSLPGAYDVLSSVVARHGLPCGAAMGLDEAHVDARAKGDALGELAARPDCYVALADCETHYDTSPTRRDEMRELGAAFRGRAPCATCIAQPWPEPLLHATFPYEEENAFVDANAYQAYFNAWKASRGAHRYAALGPLFREQWATLEASRLAACPRPTMLTIEGYGWDDIVWDCVDCLLRNPAVIVWCDPFPSRAVKNAIRAVGALAARGFTGADAVRAFQADAKRSGAFVGDVDGKCGPVTMGALGIAP